MPRKRRVDKFKQQITDAEWNYLSDVPMPHDDFDWIILDGDLHHNIETLWKQNREIILAEHIKSDPGTRPSMWWRYDAPRMAVSTFPHCYYDGELPMPRKRLGGTGTAAHEVLAVKPAFPYGVSDCWMAINQADPPVSESQAAYLKRNGLLFAGEERNSDFESEIVSARNFL